MKPLSSYKHTIAGGGVSREEVLTFGLEKSGPLVNGTAEERRLDFEVALMSRNMHILWFLFKTNKSFTFH